MFLFLFIRTIKSGWRTRAQLLQMHGMDNALVDAIIDKKVSMGEFKDHPDCPDEESAILYYVLVSLDMVNEDETEEKTQIDMDITANLGSEASCTLNFCRQKIID